MSADDLTWTKAKNALLVGAAGVVVLVALSIQADVSKTRSDVSELKIAFAGYKAQSDAEAKAMDERVKRLERTMEARR